MTTNRQASAFSGEDQATGLRRLLAGGAANSIAVMSGARASGKTSVLVNLAAALARSGQKVLIVDENANGIASACGFAARHDLLHVLRGELALEAVAIQLFAGVSLLPAARLARELPRIGVADRDRSGRCIETLARHHDVVLIDGADTPHSLTRSAHAMLVVHSSCAPTVTDTYALIKRLNLDHGRRDFCVLVNQAGSGAEAHAEFDTMARVAGRFLAIPLRFGGWIPRDRRLAAGNGTLPLIDAHSAAPAANAFRRVAAQIADWLGSAGEARRSGAPVYFPAIATAIAAAH